MRFLVTAAVATVLLCGTSLFAQEQKGADQKGAEQKAGAVGGPLVGLDRDAADLALELSQLPAPEGRVDERLPFLEQDLEPPRWQAGRGQAVVAGEIEQPSVLRPRFAEADQGRGNPLARGGQAVVPEGGGEE